MLQIKETFYATRAISSFAQLLNHPIVPATFLRRKHLTHCFSIRREFFNMRILQPDCPNKHGHLRRNMRKCPGHGRPLKYFLMPQNFEACAISIGGLQNKKCNIQASASPKTRGIFYLSECLSKNFFNKDFFKTTQFFGIKNFSSMTNGA